MLKKIFMGACCLLLVGAISGCFLLIKPAVKVTKTAVKVTGTVVKTTVGVATAPLR